MKKSLFVIVALLASCIALPASAADTAKPVVGAPSPASATVGVAVNVTANVSDADSGIASCSLYVEFLNVAAMNVSGGVAGVSHVFAEPGVYTVFVFCRDNAGNFVSGPNQSVLVSGAAGGSAPPATPPVEPPAPAAPTLPAAGTRLIKLACPPNAGPFDACRSVYYQGTDGKRHAFPSDKVYFSWYADFSGIETVDGAALAAIPLGANVTYRPGVKLVKFESVNKVYAVSRGGVLRWITTESAASALYGAAWATMVNDVSDSFFGNYAFGADIVSGADYAPAAETSATATIDANVR